VVVERASGAKCSRCWNYSETVKAVDDADGICARCENALKEIGR
jgi:isoleucyl-tRNA synthetase